MDCHIPRLPQQVLAYHDLPFSTKGSEPMVLGKCSASIAYLLPLLVHGAQLPLHPSAEGLSIQVLLAQNMIILVGWCRTNPPLSTFPTLTLSINLDLATYARSSALPPVFRST